MTPRLSDLARFAAVVIQLGLLLFTLQVFHLESRAFIYTVALALVGLPLHHFLPWRWRLPCFALLSLAGIGVVLGLYNAAWLVTIGGTLIGLAHIPVRFTARLVLLGMAAAALASMRAQWIPAPWPAALWPILGSMFMFRLIIYLYDLRHRAAPFGPWRSLAYFFMLPNICFPLFPVVDYKSFCVTYHNDERFKIYQKGLTWMFRGIVHLLAYRFVYQNLVIDPEAVAGAGDLARYMVTTFLLYLRISGMFHLSVGLLHLFGFNLSETHHRYLLSASFINFWRRINIYWRDFMMKIVFYPLVFRFKDRLDRVPALVLATAIAFVATWLLHSYQWFWLRGSFPITWRDAIFWLVLGVLVIQKTLRDLRRPGRRPLQPAAHTLRSVAVRALSTIGVFTTICILWSIWTSESIGAWMVTVSRGAHVSATDAALIVGGLAVVGMAGVLFGGSTSERTEAAGKAGATARPFPFWRSALTTGALCSVMLIIGSNPRLLPMPGVLAGTIDRLRSSQLNPQDVAALERGYYEELNDISRLSPELWQLYRKGAIILDHLHEIDEVRHVNDLRVVELPPSDSFVYKGTTLTTNRWSMRDREYEMVPDPGTYRIVLLGASYSMGGGVEEDETYENLLEDRLNREHAGHPYQRYEILNLSVGGYGPLRKLKQLETRAFDFHPDAVFYIGHGRELIWAGRGLARAVIAGFDIPWEYPASLSQQVGLEKNMALPVAAARAAPHAGELLRWVYSRLVEQCRRRGIEPYFAYLPKPRPFGEESRAPEIIALGSDAGFTVLDGSRTFDGIGDHSALILHMWDWHYNAEAHRLFADELYRKFVPQLRQAQRPAENE